MDELTKRIAQILQESMDFFEDGKPPKKGERPIVVYSGRFQPFHAGHYSVYKAMVDKFGEDRVFIASSGKTDNKKSPFEFDEKQHIIHKMFNVPRNRIVKVKSPYSPTEITSQFPEDTPIVMPVSQKDAERLSGRGDGGYFKKYSSDGPKVGYKDGGYAFVAPEFQMDVDGMNISGTAVRKVMGDPNVPEKEKARMFEKLYGKMDDEVFSLITGRLQSISQSSDEPIQKKGKAPPKDKKVRRGTPDISGEKILNPETKNKILVKTALGYDKSHPARKHAEKFLSKKVKKEGFDKVKHYLEYYQNLTPTGMTVLREGNKLIIEVEDLNESILMEGGAAGHMLHPYEDNELSFAGVRDIIRKSLLGELGSDASEKLDGQNIMFTAKDGEIRFARNKGHVKNRGENSMDTDELIDKFAGRGHLEVSFGQAGVDLRNAVSSLSPEEVESMFGNGQKFMNVEIIHPDAENAVPYGRNVLVIHGTHTFDDDGNVVDVDTMGGVTMADALRKVGAEQQGTYGIQGPNFIVFNDEENEAYKEKAKKYVTDVKKIMDDYKLSPSDTIGDMKEKAWRRHLDKVEWLSEPKKDALIQRWVHGNKKAIGAKDFDKPEKEWFRSMDSKVREVNEEIISPIKTTILRVGADSIMRSANLLSANNPGALPKIQKSVRDAVKAIKSAPRTDRLERLMQQIDYLEEVGFDKLAPSEGIVFGWGDKIYKFTGAFAPMNQIVGAFKFEDLGLDKSTTDDSTDDGKGDDVSDPSSSRRGSGDQPDPSKKKSVDYTGTVRNPETDRDIQIKTALGYPEDHPAHRAARKKIKQ